MECDVVSILVIKYLYICCSLIGVVFCVEDMILCPVDDTFAYLYYGSLLGMFLVAMCFHMALLPGVQDRNKVEFQRVSIVLLFVRVGLMIENKVPHEFIFCIINLFLHVFYDTLIHYSSVSSIYLPYIEDRYEQLNEL